MWQGITGFLGGMGLFFAGLKLTGAGVKKIADRRFRLLFLKWTRSRVQAAGIGLAAGFLFQSISGLSLLLASLIGAGVTTVRGALPVLLGANGGVSFLVLVAVVDIRQAVMLVIGLAGLILVFEKPARLLDLAGIAFGVALILFGLAIVRESTAPLAQAAWFQAFMARQGLPLPAYFAIGAVACILLQTSAGVSILAVTLAASGIFDVNDALIVMYGGLCGSSLLSLFYASPLTGAQKRLAMGQVYFNFIGLAVFLPLFILEHNFGIPLLLAGLARLLPSLPERLSALGILFDCGTALMLLCVVGPYDRLLARLHPDAAHGLGSLAFIRELSNVSPEVALFCVNREQERLLRHLPDYTARLRQGLEQRTAPSVRELHQAASELCDRIDDALLDMVARGQADANANGVALLQGIQAALRAMNDTLEQLVHEVLGHGFATAMPRVSGLLLEALDTLLLETASVFLADDAEAWEVFFRLAADKGPVMERLRDRYLAEPEDLPLETKARLLRVTGLFERHAWLSRRLGEQQRRFLRLMGDDAAPGEVTAPANARA